MVLRRVLRRGSEKGVSRRCLEHPLVEYAPLGVRPISLGEERLPEVTLPKLCFENSLAAGTFRALFSSSKAFAIAEALWEGGFFLGGGFQGSEGRGCLEEGCLGLPALLPDIS